MSDLPSLVDIGKLSEPATKLIEKISDGIGGLCAPWQMKRLARAETEAAITKAGGDIEIDQLRRRAVHRFIDEEARKQENIEEITGKAIPLLNPAAEPEKINDDWLVNFFDKSRIVSDEQMQQLWAKVLAGEANQQGSFSRRTVNLMGDLDTRDANTFSSLCRFVWRGLDMPIVFEPNGEIYTANGVNFENLTHLDSLGLVSFDPIGGYSRQNLPEDSFTISYFGTPLELEVAGAKPKLKIGKVLFVQPGQELFRICKAEPVSGFYEYVANKWSEHVPSRFKKLPLWPSDPTGNPDQEIVAIEFVFAPRAINVKQLQGFRKRLRTSLASAYLREEQGLSPQRNPIGGSFLLFEFSALKFSVLTEHIREAMGKDQFEFRYRVASSPSIETKE